nr:L-serine ammonia-lyase, iron-sulfur-dependent, subunit alpha [uncultured Blautia sp.]
MDGRIYDAYVEILKEELVPAMGCTEPIAIAYAAAVARETLGSTPKTVRISASGNIIKNVKSVVVPNTGGLRGIAAAAAAGIIAGKAEKKLEVLAEITKEEIEEISDYLKAVPFQITASDSKCIFDIYVEVQDEEHSAEVQIQGHHTNIVQIRKNGETLFGKEYSEDENGTGTDRHLLNVEQIITFANEVKISDVKETIERQIEYNMAIAREGLRGNWGANIGKILLQSYGNSVQNRAKAMAAAGSDARMNGCEMPVVINSGSGNQGMTASLPVIVYAEDMQVSRETLIRALVVSNLVSIHLKTGIGTLSAYCGAISAGCGAGAGITYLYGGGYTEVAHTIVNALAINSGVVCDGAKASCAAKIASAVEAGTLGMKMYQFGSQFYGGDGIVATGIEETIDNVGQLARDGMRETDKKIIEIMIDKI